MMSLHWKKKQLTAILFKGGQHSTPRDCKETLHLDVLLSELDMVEALPVHEIIGRWLFCN